MPPGPGGGQADAQLAGVLGVGAGHEGRRLLVPHLDEADLVLALAQRLHDAVDAVAGEAEDHLHAPVHDRFDENVAASVCHEYVSCDSIVSPGVGDEVERTAQMTERL